MCVCVCVSLCWNVWNWDLRQLRNMTSVPQGIIGFCLAVQPGDEEIGIIGRKRGTKNCSKDPIPLCFLLFVIYSTWEFPYAENFMTGYRMVFDREALKLGWSRSSCEFSDFRYICQFFSHWGLSLMWLRSGCISDVLVMGPSKSQAILVCHSSLVCLLFIISLFEIWWISST